ncbi:MAG: VTC domain-containing protein [Desulfobulbaceae bacterium]|nr:VTC domain-containing protein [Desulfobulbaceae bacterium]
MGKEHSRASSSYYLVIMVLSELIEKRGEFELKYTFPNLFSPTLNSWLSVNCRKDQSYPESRVQSIYLETNLADSYQEKVNSDFFKTKYRVRWYETLDRNPYEKTDIVSVFLENKMKIGTKRLKNRWLSKSSFAKLKSERLNSDFHGGWYQLFSDKNEEIIPFLQPFIQISYTRKRFVEVSTNTRISLDYDIRVEKTNSTLLPRPHNIALETGVFEVKSDSNSPPSSLAYLTSNLVSKANFSKYEQCVTSLEV